MLFYIIFYLLQNYALKIYYLTLGTYIFNQLIHFTNIKLVGHHKGILATSQASTSLTKQKKKKVSKKHLDINKIIPVFGRLKINVKLAKS